jgi:hypothetical protein
LGRLVRPFLDRMALGFAGYSIGRSEVYGLAIFGLPFYLSVIAF